MPILDDLLLPIPGDAPSGSNLQYESVYIDIREARREEDDTSQGVWQRTAKKADYPLVIKLATAALRSKSKDLQIAAWLTEALTYQEGLPGLKYGLSLIFDLLDNFWDSLYPELEDGAAELRAVPLSYLGPCLDRPLKQVALAEGGYNWVDYTHSYAMPREDEDDEKKRSIRTEAIADGQVTPEEFNAAFQATPKSFYTKFEAELNGLMQTVRELNEYCAEQFGDVAPDFDSLTRSLQDVYGVVHVLLMQKRELEPDVAEEPAPTPTVAEVARPIWSAAPEPPAALHPAMSKPAVPAATSAVMSAIASREDAARGIAAICEYLRNEDSYSPAPYMILRGWRWGELRSSGAAPGQLDAPSTEVRQQLRKLWLACDWSTLLDATEQAMAHPCGRAWLDLQAFAVRACEETGRSAIASAILAELRGLLADLPRLVDELMLDGTPAANPETQRWLREVVLPQPRVEEPVQPRMEEASMFEHVERSSATPQPAPPETYELALEAARRGRTEEALELLSHRPAEETTGRARFQRRVQLAQICMSAGHEDIAYPILEELAREVEEHHLEQWESEELIAYPLALLYQCIEKLKVDSGEAKRVYAQVCRLNPVQALRLPH